MEERVPVAHADIDGQALTRLRESLRETACLTARQFGDRRHAVEQVVVAGHFLEPGRRHSPTPQHVGEKRSDIVGPVGAAERDHQDGIERV